MREITISAPAKINWSINVEGQRPDGYHLLRMLMQNISLADTVHLRPAAYDSCYCDRPLAGEGENIALAAWRLLKQRYGIKACLRIGIEKRIPIGAGLGGGSADAAAVLKGASDLFELGLFAESLQQLGLQLGADVPFALVGGLALVEGIGEQVTVLPAAPRIPLLLLNPGVTVATAAVYGNLAIGNMGKKADIETLAFALMQGDLAAIERAMANQLTGSCFQLFPPVAALYQRVRDMRLPVLLSGSGGTLFAFGKDAAEAAKELSRSVPWLMLAETI